MRLFVLLVVGGVATFFGYQIYQFYDYPPGYRNRPSTSWHRLGEAEFDAANARIDAFKDSAAFGNSPAAIELAQEFSTTLRAARAKLFTQGLNFEILETTKGEFMTSCELHPEECAFLVHVPALRKFNRDFTEKVDARKLLSQIAWATAQTVLKNHGLGRPQMELAVGLRGISQYGPIMIGYYKEDYASPDDGLVKFLDDPDKTHFLYSFFAPPAIPASTNLNHQTP